MSGERNGLNRDVSARPPSPPRPGHPREREKLEIRSTLRAAERSVLTALRPTPPSISATPPSSLLSRLQAFLPVMEAANQDLARADPTSLDIEHQSPARDTDEDRDENRDDDLDTRHIELDLQCGVLDLHTEAAVRAAENALSHGQGTVVVERFDGDGDGDTSSDEEEQRVHEVNDQLEGPGPGPGPGTGNKPYPHPHPVTQTHTITLTLTLTLTLTRTARIEAVSISTSKRSDAGRDCAAHRRHDLPRPAPRPR